MSGGGLEGVDAEHERRASEAEPGARPFALLVNRRDPRVARLGPLQHRVRLRLAVPQRQE